MGKHDKPYVVAVGNPFDGISLYGPFEDTEEANEWGEHNAHGSEWWTMNVQKPDNESSTERFRYIVSIETETQEQADEIIGELHDHEDDYGIGITVEPEPRSGVFYDHMTEQEYDVRIESGGWKVNDDTGRDFFGKTLEEAVARARGALIGGKK